MSGVEAVAMILSVVALAVTVLGFFASLRFYRDGTDMQQAAFRALATIEEKANSIQHHVGGMFERTLDAAISKNDELSNQYRDLRQQLEATTTTLLEEATSQIDAKSQAGRDRIASTIQAEMAKVGAKIDETQEAAEDLTSGTQSSPAITGGVQLEVLSALSYAEEPMPLSVIAQRCSLSPGGLSFVVDALRRKELVAVDTAYNVSGLVITAKGREAVELATAPFVPRAV